MKNKVPIEVYLKANGIVLLNYNALVVSLQVYCTTKAVIDMSTLTKQDISTSSKGKHPTTAETARSETIHLTQNFLVVWFHDSIDQANNRECTDIIRRLREIVHTVYAFNIVNECVDFITQMKEEHIFLITSGAYGLQVIKMVHEMPQISSIYVFDGERAESKQWLKDWSKIDGIFTNIVMMCGALKKMVQAYEQNLISISIVEPLKETGEQNPDDVDRSFMYTQVLKEILLNIEFHQCDIDHFVHYCHEQFLHNPKELANVNRLKEEYTAYTPIWWYTYRSFLQPMLNRALRPMEVDLITKMGFFVRDLHQRITNLHKKQSTKYGRFAPLTVYRAQGLSKLDFNRLKQTKDGFLSFNNFLLATKDRHGSLNFARDMMETSDLIGIVFAIEIDSAQSSTPFANVHDESYFQGSEAILFSMQSVFRVRGIKRLEITYRLWEVTLTPTSDEDPELLALTEYIRKETFGHLKGWYRLGNFFFELGKFDKAEYVFESMLQQSTDDCEKGNIYHKLGEVKERQGKYVEAIQLLEKSLGIRGQFLTSTGVDSNSSSVHRESGYPNSYQQLRRLQDHLKALQSRQQILTPNHVLIGLSYNNIGQVYYGMGEYSKALLYHENALYVFRHSLPSKHPDVATCHHNIGLVHYSMNEYEKALSSYEKALEIRQEILAPDHPDLAISYSSHGSGCYSMGEYSKAFSSYEKSIAISRKTLPPYHPGLITSYNDIITSYSKAGKCSKAFAACGRALEIYQNITPQNNTDLATSYNNIGGVYNQLGAHFEALVCFEKALKLFEETLPTDHPDLAISYCNVGGEHFELGNLPQALVFYEKALKLRKAVLPPNHPDFAQSYNNLGGAYFEIRNYSKAHRYFKSALELGKRLLPSDHPDLCKYQDWIKVIEAYL